MVSITRAGPLQDSPLPAGDSKIYDTPQAHDEGIAYLMPSCAHVMPGRAQMTRMSSRALKSPGRGTRTCRT